MIDRLDTYNLNDKNTPRQVEKVASKVNELADELNRLKAKPRVMVTRDDGETWVPYEPKESAKKETPTITPSIPGKILIDTQALAQNAVADYKARLIEKLKTQRVANPRDEWAYGLVIEDIEETL